MGSEWQKRRIGDLGRVVTGKTPSTAIAENFGGDYPFITIPDMDGRREITSSARSLSEQGAQSLRTCRLPAGAVMMSCIATIGKCGITTGPSFTNQQINSLICGDDADPKFIYYCFTQLGHAVEAVGGGGSVYTNVSKSRFEEIEIGIPPLAEQKRIAGILGALDDKIELNRRMNQNLEAMARALFKSWFVDFDPVRAKADGQAPSGLAPATAALFPDSFQDSAIGQSPTGWEVCSLASKITLLSGGTPKTSESAYWNGDIPWYSVKDAPADSDVWVMQTEKQVTSEGIANSAAQVLPEGTTIISARGTVGKLALTGVPMAMNQSCYGVRGVLGYGDYFTYYALRQATAELQRRTHGSVFDTITRQTFETLDCIFPPAELTAAFDRTVAPYLLQIRANLHQSRTLANLRDTLLPKLLSGEISTGN